MMEKVIALYEKETANRAAYDAAEIAGDQAAMEAARTQHKENCQAARDNGSDFCFMLRLYTEMKDRGNELIDLNDVHDYQVAGVMTILHLFGIQRFTFSSTWSSAISTVWEISKHGYKLDGMVQINGEYPKILTHEFEKIPAFIFTINE